MILRAERIRQGKGQKEVCYGICVVSYLSKIERGSAEPDMAILKQLFARLGINYETDSAFLTESRKQIDEFFYNLQYGLENETVWKKLAGKWDRLLMSPLTIDIRLVSAIYYSESAWKEVDKSFIESLMKKEADGNDIQNFLNENVSTLVRLEDCMDEKQYAYYSLVCSRLTKDPAEKMEWYQKVQHGLQNTLVQWLARYISVYLWLPVADLFGAMLAKIQTLILQEEMNLMADPMSVIDVDGSSAIYLIFMVIGIIGYFCVPTVSNWIVQAGGMSAYNRNVNNTASKVTNVAGAAAGASTGNVGAVLLKK